jgi:mono/diheme cytochrome c family protein
MSPFARRTSRLARWACCLAAAMAVVHGAEATLYRALNLNGPELVLDGRKWEGSNAPAFTAKGNRFENQSVPLRPATDPRRAQMIRSSVWGSRVELEMTGVPTGDYQVFVHVWEDTQSEQFDLVLNDRVVAEKFHSGLAGSWKRLGPWPVRIEDGRLRLFAKAPNHGAANLSGLEVWSGDGPVPDPSKPVFNDDPTAEQLAFFEGRIRPVFVEHCHECHSAGAAKLKGGLLLDSKAGVRQGGDSGPLMNPASPDSSLLVRAVRHEDPDLAMPPRRRIPEAAVADLVTWIGMGAPDPRTEDTVAATASRSGIDWKSAKEWWAFRPVSDPEPPAVRDAAWPAGPIDRFLLARIEDSGLAPSPEADRATLLRRVTFDLTGLPPTPSEIDAFLADTDVGAWERAVDRLLASPAYGERWGRHWLDVVRYADTAGDNSDFPIPQMHRYRDWVIDAFNRDLPFDEFVRQQLAGDLLQTGRAETDHQRTIATGWIANARRFGSRVDDYPQHLTIEDTLDNLGKAFLGLTINCARCHDHKFDPIPTSDYYALYGIFDSTRYPWPGIELDQRQRDLVPLVEPERREEMEEARRRHDEEKRRLEKAVKELREESKSVAAAEKAAAEKRIQEAESAVRAHADRGLPFGLAYAVADKPKASDAVIQIKGDPARPGGVVPRRFLTVLGGSTLADATRGSGRAELADWIVAPTNPLTARVMVNRVWQHHFGRGLVATPNDFGRQGRAPTHPELLDWLASRFREDGWSVKALHRRILLSRAYRQSSVVTEEQSLKDPTNELLGRFPRRRLDAESLRDTLLVLGGNLEPAPRGPHPFPKPSDWKFTQHNPFRAVYETRSRSVYLMTQRIQRHPYLAIFDGADPSTSTGRRTSSTTPLQALFLLNDPFVHGQADLFAGRLRGLRASDTDRVREGFRLALGRSPSEDDTEKSLAFLKSARERSVGETDPEAEAWRAFARVLFRLNEFAQLD